MIPLLSHMSLIAALAGYSVSSGLFLHAFPQAEARASIYRAAIMTFILATLFVLFALIMSLSEVYYSQTSGLLLIVTMSVVTILVSLKSKIKLLGILVSPLATLVLIFLAFTYPAHNHTAAAHPPLLMAFHIFVASLGQAFAIAASATSFFYLFQQRALKKKLFNFITKATPPLDKLEQTLMFSLWAGCGCLTLGLFSGAIYVGFFASDKIEGLGYKITWAVLVWIWYLAILLARNVLGQSTKRIAKMSLAGFILLFLAFFGLVKWGTL